MLYTVFIYSIAVHSSNTFSQQYTDRLFIHSGMCVWVGRVNSHYGGANITALDYQCSQEEPQENNYFR